MNTIKYFVFSVLEIKNEIIHTNIYILWYKWLKYCFFLHRDAHVLFNIILNCDEEPNAPKRHSPMRTVA